jgi:drug/metabolite transporter (DMT)-like permease
MSAAPTPFYIASRLLACSVLWASGFLFIKLSGPVHPFALAAVRGSIGAATLTLLFLAQRKSIWPRGPEWRHWAFLGTFNGWGPNVLVAYALSQITAASASMIQAASPLIVALLSHALFAEERLTPRRAIGVLIGFVGMGILIGPAAFPESGVSATGALAMAATAVSYAVGNVYARTLKEEPSRLALGQQIFSALPAVILALVLTGPTAFAAVPAHWAPLLALGIIATAAPMLLFMRLIRTAGPTRASMVGYLLPVWATLLGLAFLGEPVGLREILGGLVVLAGVALVSFSGRLKR